MRSSLGMPKKMRCAVLLVALSTTLVAGAVPTFAWSPNSQKAIGKLSLRLAPEDFERQLARNEEQFLRGIAAPFDDRDASLHQGHRDGGRVQEVIVRQVERTIAAIQAHRTFADIAFMAGVAVHYMNDANNPLNCSNDDQDERRYYADFLTYLESTESRVEVLFYGLDPGLEKRDVAGFVKATLERCREHYPLVGQEYRRIGQLPGTRFFDDRSTAFGVSAVAHSRAVTDAALLLRYIWLEAGGADWRSPPMEDEGRLLLLPRR